MVEKKVSLMLLFSVVILLTTFGFASATTLYVDDDYATTNSTHFNSINSALSVADDGDVILVADGTYDKAVEGMTSGAQGLINIYKKVTIEAIGSNAIIDATDVDGAFKIHANSMSGDQVVIEGFKITGELASDIAITALVCSNTEPTEIIIRNNEIYDVASGFDVWGWGGCASGKDKVESVLIEGNSFHDLGSEDTVQGYGALLEGLVSDGDTEGTGYSAIVRNNNFYNIYSDGSDYGVGVGIPITDTGSVLIQNNEFNNLPLGVGIGTGDVSNINIEGNNFESISLFGVYTGSVSNGPVNAEDNYWGNEFGASSSVNTGFGASITENVDACPFLNDVYGTGTSTACYLDTDGPVISNINLSSEYNSGVFDVSAVATDNRSKVNSVGYFVGSSSNVDCIGVPDGYLSAEDGNFDELLENVYKSNVKYENDGQNGICLQATDSLGNEGSCVCKYYETDTIPPEVLLNITLNGVSNPNELLVCGNNPTLSLTVCDSESEIQGGEFFLNLITGASPAPWTGYWLKVIGEQFTDNGKHCAIVEGQIDGNDSIGLLNFSELSDGTHYITQIRGKDIVENWGKVSNQNLSYSFIKDTTAPLTEKILTPVDNESVSCQVDNEINGHLLDGGCAYVKQGTTITLNANDYNPDNSTNEGYNNLDGEYAGLNTTYYRIWWSEDCGETDDWTVKSEGVYNGTITLNEDSCHLIEYWSTDLCGYEEEHHYELDIVDTQAPIITSEITGPYFNDTEENKIYVDNATRINLTCVDQEPHPVDNVKLYYRYFVEGSLIQNWTEYEGPIWFPQESHHVLEYYCEDALGNSNGSEENPITEDYYVDHTKPITTLSYGTPLVEKNVSSNWAIKWITSQTNITLNATDGNKDHDSGVNYTKYRITKIPDQYCKTVASGCTWYNNEHTINSDWETYEDSPFTISETSCHLIEYYSVDNVNKTETLKEDCVFVDNEAPITTKTVGEPKLPMNSSCDPQTEICDYWITQNTPITLSCEDDTSAYNDAAHAVGNVTLNYRTTIDGEVLQDWTSTNGSVLIQFENDSNHTVEWYCSDALGNSETLKIENDTVDTQGPTVVRKYAKIMREGEETYGDAIEEVNGSEVEIALRSEDTVKLCADVIDYKQTGDLGVGVKNVSYQFVGLDDPQLTWDEDEQAYCVVKQGKDIRNNYCSSYNCGQWQFLVKGKDFLGNKGNWTNGLTVIVDNIAPQVTYVLNPVNGRYYNDGMIFTVQAPAIDFGGDYSYRHDDSCPASGIDYCEFYAVHYPFEQVNQSEVKNKWDYMWQLYGDNGVFNNANIAYLGRVPYEDGYCQGTLEMNTTGLGQKAFLAYRIVDKAGNVNGENDSLATDMNGNYIIMDLDDSAPNVTITDLGNTVNILTSTQYVTGLTTDVVDPDSGFDSCYADIYFMNGTDTGFDLDGKKIGSKTCEINGQVPGYGNINSGNYELRIYALDKLGNKNYEDYAWASLIIDNDKPTMSIVSPSQNSVYGEMFPVSLDVQDSQSSIANETVMFKIKEIPAFGNVYCLFGATCEDSGWVNLNEQSNGLYATTINLTEYGISGDGRYTFDAVACDSLYGYSESNHCIQLSKETVEDIVNGYQVTFENRTACNDGIDNDLDGYVDLADSNCSSVDDTDESS